MSLLPYPSTPPGTPPPGIAVQAPPEEAEPGLEKGPALLNPKAEPFCKPGSALHLLDEVPSSPIEEIALSSEEEKEASPASKRLKLSPAALARAQAKVRTSKSSQEFDSFVAFCLASPELAKAGPRLHWKFTANPLGPY